MFEGNEFKAIHLAHKENTEIFISEHIVDETLRVMMEKFPEYITQFREFIDISEIKVIPKEQYLIDIVRYDDIRDKYDQHILAAAVLSKCDYVISGDKDLLNYDTDKIDIINARDLLKRLKLNRS